MLTDNDLMPWGKKFYGKRMIDIPSHYLLYVYDAGYLKGGGSQEVRQYIEANREILEKEKSRSSRYKK